MTVEKVKEKQEYGQVQYHVKLFTAL